MAVPNNEMIHVLQRIVEDRNADPSPLPSITVDAATPGPLLPWPEVPAARRGEVVDLDSRRPKKPIFLERVAEQGFDSAVQREQRDGVPTQLSMELDRKSSLTDDHFAAYRDAAALHREQMSGGAANQYTPVTTETIGRKAAAHDEAMNAGALESRVSTPRRKTALGAKLAELERRYQGVSDVSIGSLLNGFSHVLNGDDVDLSSDRWGEKTGKRAYFWFKAQKTMGNGMSRIETVETYLRELETNLHRFAQTDVSTKGRYEIVDKQRALIAEFRELFVNSTYFKRMKNSDQLCDIDIDGTTHSVNKGVVFSRGQKRILQAFDAILEKYDTIHIPRVMTDEAAYVMTANYELVGTAGNQEASPIQYQRTGDTAQIHVLPGRNGIANRMRRADIVTDPRFQTIEGVVGATAESLLNTKHTRDADYSPASEASVTEAANLTETVGYVLKLPERAKASIGSGSARRGLERTQEQLGQYASRPIKKRSLWSSVVSYVKTLLAPEPRMAYHAA